MRQLFIAVICVLSATTAFASDVAADTVDDYIHQEMQTRKIPGLAIAVLRGDKIIKQSVYGKASLELNVPVKPDTLFPLSSLSKEFTGVAIMLLTERHKISLDDPIRKFLPELPNAWADVTIRHALSHTSGLPDSIRDSLNVDPIAGTWEDALHELSPQSVNVPGAKTAYNQTGYALLGQLIERVSGQSFQAYVEENLLKPHRMKSAVYGDSWEILAARTESYTAVEPTENRMRLAAQNGRPVQSDRVHRLGLKPSPEWLHPVAGLNASIDDLANWEAALIGGRIISQSSLAQMTEPHTLNDGKSGTFGLTFLAGEFEGRKYFASGGGAAVWCLRARDEKLTILVLSNLQGSSPETLAAGVANKYLAQDKRAKTTER